MALVLPFVLALTATPARADHESGSVIVAIAHPAIVRMLYNGGVQTNLIGVVFQVPGSAKGQTYTLTRTSGFGNLDVYFYADDDGEIGEICNVPPIDDDDLDQSAEVAPICPGEVIPGWGIIVLRTGFNAGFSFHY